MLPELAWNAQCQEWPQTSDSISTSQVLGLQTRMPPYLVLMLRTETWEMHQACALWLSCNPSF